MNNDLISRSELKSLLENECFWCANQEEPCDKSCWHCINEKIDNAPTVDFEKLGESLNCQIRATYGSCDDCLLSCPRNELIKLLGLARPQGEWVPVSERLPNDRDWYLGLFKEPDTGFIGMPYICDYVGEVTKGTTNEGWILRHCTDVDNASDYFRNLICVAWQPLPEPYMKGSAE